MDTNNDAELFDEDKYPVFDLWGEDITSDHPDDLLARIITDDEEDYEDEFFDSDEFE